jgi:hypothetical protein
MSNTSAANLVKGTVQHAGLCAGNEIYLCTVQDMRVISANCESATFLPEVGEDTGEPDEIVRFPHECILKQKSYHLADSYGAAYTRTQLSSIRKQLSYTRDEIKQGKGLLFTDNFRLHLPPRNHEKRHYLK